MNALSQALLEVYEAEIASRKPKVNPHFRAEDFSNKPGWECVLIQRVDVSANNFISSICPPYRHAQQVDIASSMFKGDDQSITATTPVYDVIDILYAVSSHINPSNFTLTHTIHSWLHNPHTMYTPHHHYFMSFNCMSEQADPVIQKFIEQKIIHAVLTYDPSRHTYTN
jgi:hypothetical protein